MKKHLLLLILSQMFFLGYSQSNVVDDNDSLYYDYIKYEIPILSVSVDKVCEMLESIVISTAICESTSCWGVDIHRTSYVLDVYNKYDLYAKIFDYYGVEDYKDLFYVEAYDYDVMDFIDIGDYYGVLYFNERLFLIKEKNAEKYFAKTGETLSYTLRRRNDRPKPPKYHNGSFVIEYMFSDPYMEWLFVVHDNDKIKLKERGSCCDNIPDIRNYMIEEE